MSTAALKLADLKTLAARVKAKEDPRALVDGCRFTSRPDPCDARFQIIEIRGVNPAMAGAPSQEISLSGEEAARAFLELCVSTARSVGMK